YTGRGTARARRAFTCKPGTSSKQIAKRHQEQEHAHELGKRSRQRPRQRTPREGRIQHHAQRLTGHHERHVQSREQGGAQDPPDDGWAAHEEQNEQTIGHGGHGEHGRVGHRQLELQREHGQAVDQADVGPDSQCRDQPRREVPGAGNRLVSRSHVIVPHTARTRSGSAFFTWYLTFPRTAGSSRTTASLAPTPTALSSTTPPSYSRITLCSCPCARARPTPSVDSTGHGATAPASMASGRRLPAASINAPSRSIRAVKVTPGSSATAERSGLMSGSGSTTTGGRGTAGAGMAPTGAAGMRAALGTATGARQGRARPRASGRKRRPAPRPGGTPRSGPTARPPRTASASRRRSGPSRHAPARYC